MDYQGIAPSGIDTSGPHPARVYDYLLGGHDNYEVDRIQAEGLLVALPRLRDAARENRLFLQRAVRSIVGAGVRQIIDVGTGIPTSPNTHEVAQAVAPRTRVVYVDNEPIVQVHAQAILTKAPNTAFALADLRDPQAILDHPNVRAVIDFDLPVALLLVAVLHFVSQDPAQYIAVLRDALVAGSYLAITHATADDVRDDVDGAVKTYREAAVSVNPRDRREVLALFDGFDLVDPGLVTVAEWRPDPGVPKPTRYGIYAGVGVKR